MYRKDSQKIIVKRKVSRPECALVRKIYVNAIIKIITCYDYVFIVIVVGDTKIIKN